MRFQQELCGGRGSLRIWRQHEAKSLQDLCNVEELRSQGASLSIHSQHEAFLAHFEEGHDQLATHCLALGRPLLFACEGLILGHVEERMWSLEDLVHEALFQNRLHVVPPSDSKRASNNCMRCNVA